MDASVISGRLQPVPAGNGGEATFYPRESLVAHPSYRCPDYLSTRKRAPSHPLILIPHTLTELSGPAFGHESVHEGDADLTRQHPGEPLGERIIVSGRVADESGRPVPDMLLEIWQANAAGRYAHAMDQHDAPLDANFSGAGRTVTDGEGRYSFTTIRPGAYPWRNHANAWRPAHIHFSLFGPTFLTRLVTQMYFPGDPLLERDPIFNSLPDENARRRLLAAFDWDTTKPEWALGYRFDIVVRGRAMTPFEEPHDE
jgi:protocatechuate 3,4-dioxygenase, beta subunit